MCFVLLYKVFITHYCVTASAQRREEKRSCKKHHSPYAFPRRGAGHGGQIIPSSHYKEEKE